MSYGTNTVAAIDKLYKERRTSMFKHLDYFHNNEVFPNGTDQIVDKCAEPTKGHSQIRHTLYLSVVLLTSVFVYRRRCFVDRL